MAQLLTPVEAATYLNVSPRTLEDWRCRLVGPPYMKPAGTSTVRYKAADLEQWINESMQTGQA